MIAALLLPLLAAPAPSSVAPRPVPVTRQDDVEARIRAAGEDVAELHRLAEEYEGASKRSAAKKVHERIVELAPDDEVSRKALRHQFYDGKWFESYVELAKYKREEEARMREKGLAAWEDRWVPMEDLPYLKLGWVRHGADGWIHPQVLKQDEQVEAWKAAGYQYRADEDSWIAPADFDHWKALEWKCGDEWRDLAGANDYHESVDHPWRIAGEHFLVLTVADWETGNLARWHAEQAFPHLVRLFGTQPERKPEFFVLPNLTRYNEAASGGTPLSDSEGFSSVHGAYFADVCFDFTAEPPLFNGMGVCYWDRKDPQVAAWGPYWVRWAAAQSFVEGIDPSHNAVGDWITTGGRGDLNSYAGPFWGEKRIPRWLRYGAASYVERFLPNPEAGGDEDAWVLRDFSVSEIRKGGGLSKLETILEFGVTLQDLPLSADLYQEAGLVVAYLLDGAQGDEGLTTAHEAFKRALVNGTAEQTRAAADKLEAALRAREAEVRKFAGL